MSKTTKVIEFVFLNLDAISPLTEYATYCAEKIQPIHKLTREEYQSLVASYEFNSKSCQQ